MKKVQPQARKKCNILFVDDSNTATNHLNIFQITDLVKASTFINSTQKILKNYNTPEYPKTKLYSFNIRSKDIEHAESINDVREFISSSFDEAAFENKILPYFNSIRISSNSPPSEAKMLSS